MLVIDFLRSTRTLLDDEEGRLFFALVRSIGYITMFYNYDVVLNGYISTQTETSRNETYCTLEPRNIH